jgi:hypothetical protein
VVPRWNWNCFTQTLNKREFTVFDWMPPEKHAIAILKRDRDTVKDLFDDFEKAEKTAAKEKIIDQPLTTLKIHAVIGGRFFYPTVRAHVRCKAMNEADGEHYLAKVPIADLDRGANNNHREAKLMVLVESVRHHIRVNGRGDSPAKVATSHKPSCTRKTSAKISPASERKTSSNASR